MDEQVIWEGSYELIRKDLQLEESFQSSGEVGFEALHVFLTRRVQELLNHDFAHLLNALYRIDIPQNRVEEILNCSAPEMLASELSRAIIEREKQKMITRLKYSGQKS